MKKMLIIGGYDPTGGAGVIRDYITARDFGVYPFAVITSYTIQNPRGVKKVAPRGYKEIKEEIEYLMESVDFNVVKIGMIFSLDAAKAIKDIITSLKEDVPVIMDFIHYSKNKFSLVEKNTKDFILKNIVPHTFLLHLNCNEAEIVKKKKIECLSDAIEVGKKILEFGSKYLVITCGDREKVFDMLLGKEILLIYKSQKIEKNMHGTGCTFTSSLAACIANGMNVKKAFREARKYVKERIEKSVLLCDGCYYMPL